MKKLIILLITIFLIYLIYGLFKSYRFNCVLITDVNILDNYINKDKLSNYNIFNSSSITEIIKDIRNNKTIMVNKQEIYLKKVLRESDILVVNLGMKELDSNFNKYEMEKNYLFFNTMLSNIKRMISEIKKYAYGKIIFIGYYNPTDYYDANIDLLFHEMNKELNNLMINNDIIYVDLYEVIKGNDYKIDNSFSLNNNGYIELTGIINSYIN